jgi:sugar (pentulose or hexulose) kinase
MQTTGEMAVQRRLKKPLIMAVLGVMLVAGSISAAAATTGGFQSGTVVHAGGSSPRTHCC